MFMLLFYYILDNKCNIISKMQNYNLIKIFKEILYKYSFSILNL